MAENDFPYQPGSMLHGAILGAFRANGGSFEQWCVANGLTSSNARNVTHGISKGPISQDLLARMIKAAGPEIVKAGYMSRFDRHRQSLQKRGAL